MAQFNTFHILRNNGALFVPGVPNLPEYGRYQFTKTALNVGIERAEINYYDSAFVMDSVGDNKYRIKLFYYPDIYLKRVYDGLNYIMASREVDQYGIFTAEVTQSSDYRYGIIMLRADNGEYFCINNTYSSVGYTSNKNTQEFMKFILVNHTY